MIQRIVKLTFAEENCEAFLEIFENSKDKIKAFPGCTHLELWRCKTPDNIFMTYSHWESEDDLEEYRKSVFFRTTWAATKVLFSDKPEAWSVNRIK